MVRPVDEYSLMEWLKEQSLTAHNACVNHLHCSKCPIQPACAKIGGDCKDVTLIYEYAMNKVIEHIQNGRIDSRPHVKERI
jgi:hypothetical protein